MSLPRQPLRCERLNTGPFFTVINRTCRPLSVIVDGVTMVMEPGPNMNVPAVFAQYAERQHPRRGTFDDTIRGGETLLVVKELCADPERMSMIPPGREHLGDELTNRAEFPQPPERGELRLQLLPRQRVYEDELNLGDETPGAIHLIGDPDSDLRPR